MKFLPQTSKTLWQVLTNLESFKSFRTTEISDAVLSIRSRDWYECEKTKEGPFSSDLVQHEGEDFLYSLLQVYCLQHSLCTKTTYKLPKIRLSIILHSTVCSHSLREFLQRLLMQSAGLYHN